MRYIYMLKKSILSQIPLEAFQPPKVYLKNEGDFDAILSQEARKLSPLYLINENNYGTLINIKSTLSQKGKKAPELFRIFQNHELWEQRYIQPHIRQAVKHTKLEKPHSTNYMVPGECPNTLEVDFFTDLFFQDVTQEFLSTQEDHIDLWKVNLDLTLLAIFNFYITHVMCHYFPGAYTQVACVQLI